VPVKSDSHSLYVVCASAHEGLNQWRVFAFVEGGVIARLRGRDTSAVSLKTLFDAVKHCLESDPAVENLRQEK
jgi:hypothetical protein